VWRATQEYHVEGSTMLMMTTTAIDLEEELLNRCLVLTVDEDREQTRRIHALQREKRTLAGLTKREPKTAHLAGRAVEYIEATLADIEAANATAHEVLGRSLDELPPQTRRVLGATAGLVEALAKEQAAPRAELRVTRAQVREVTGQFFPRGEPAKRRPR
jgi:hypothetical protein